MRCRPSSLQRPPKLRHSCCSAMRVDPFVMSSHRDKAPRSVPTNLINP